MAEEGPWEGRDLLALAIGTATGLAAIHQAGLVHGDFGPEHVVLGPDGPRVVGFGITPPYGIATPAADLRAWVHTVLYAAAGGTADPEDPEDLDLLPEPLRRLAVRCMSANPADQPSARSLVLQLLGDDHPPAGVLGEGSRRAARVSVRPAAPRPRTRTRPGPGSAGRWPPGGWPGWPPASWRSPRSSSSCRTRAAARLARRSRRCRTGRPTPHRAPSPPTPAVKVPAALAGTWSGQVSQDQPGRRFQVPVNLVPGANAGICPLLGRVLLLRGRPHPGVRLLRPPEAGPGHRPGPVRGGRGHRHPGPGEHPAVQLPGEAGRRRPRAPWTSRSPAGPPGGQPSRSGSRLASRSCSSPSSGGAAATVIDELARPAVQPGDPGAGLGAIRPPAAMSQRLTPRS